MATIFGAIEGLIHDTTEAVIDSQVTTKLSGMYSSAVTASASAVTGFITAGFGVVDDVLTIVANVSAPPPPKI